MDNLAAVVVVVVVVIVEPPMIEERAEDSCAGGGGGNGGGRSTGLGLSTAIVALDDNGIELIAVGLVAATATPGTNPPCCCG